MNDIEFTNNLNLFLNTVKEQNTRTFHYKRLLIKRFPEFFEELKKRTSFLRDNCSILERLYCIEHKLTDIPDCPICHAKKLKFNAVQNRYSFYCSIKCQQNDPENRRKMYEHTDYKASVEKSKKTRAEKYGGHYNPKDFGDKVRKTKLKRYGDSHYVNQKLAHKTKLERYGNAGFNNHEKASKTKLERYGSETYNNREKFHETLSTFTKERKNEINETRRNTTVEKYGVEHIAKLQDIKNKKKRTILDRYGVEYTFNIPGVHESANAKKREMAWESVCSQDSAIPMFSKNDFCSCDKFTTINWKWKCRMCNNEFYSRYDYGRVTSHCPTCYPHGFSVAQHDVFNEIKSFVQGDCDVMECCRTVISPMELDIYIPLKNIAVEYDGLYWHSESQNPNHLYHLQKTKQCEAKNIHLVHIFEPEWVYKKSMVVSRLKQLLGMSTNQINVKDCECREITDGSVSRMFLLENDLDGYGIDPTIAFGLYTKSDNELVSLMTFAHPRFSNRHEWELIRFCTKKDWNVVNGASELFSHFEHTYHPKNIVSYADRRWTMNNGNTVYDKLGFRLDHISRPLYWYWKRERKEDATTSCAVLESKLTYQKSKLPEILENYDPSKTEAENMKLNGYDRIFDCGNLVYVKECK